ncbi:DUF6655 family protein [Stratiformator vulcanicus]|uniref:DUF3313 domain-containing protein n=1 Tax=Stratiformator vulcanicus TaxID=2527980 RepID=A0A517R5E4_9PLAN|nr:DUF6655 family protein [Stratiformator vulcanicus]QDT39116.1 hypothetical protein Pan189_35180 [Stratiformator vulcanicus]
MTVRFVLMLCSAAVIAMTGCASLKTSDTSRTGMEQMLISKAIDDSLNRIDFRPFAGRDVFLDTQFLDCVDQGYVTSATRHRLLQAGANLAGSAEDAELVCELRSGGVGTDRSETFIGIPEINLPVPVPVAIPEIKFWSRTKQNGTAKLGVVAYDTKSKTIVGDGGTTLARSEDTNTYFMGIGPFQSGEVRDSISKRSRPVPGLAPLPEQVAFSAPPPAPADAGVSRVRLASSLEDHETARPMPPAPSPEPNFSAVGWPE